MKNVVTLIISWVACISVLHAQEAPHSQSPAASQPAAAAANAAPAISGLHDLNAMTFDCPKAALNVAAREAAKAPSQGTYQFSYFNIIHDAHHATYEVHFKSNYQGEPELKYCVSMYCQQGWDPGTGKAEIRLMSNERRRGAAAHAATCGAHQGEGKRKR